MSKKTNNKVEFVIFKCKETSIPTPYYNDCIIGKNTGQGNLFNQRDPLTISVSAAKSLLTLKMINVPCLCNLGIRFYYDNNKNQITLIFDDVNFDCDKDLQKPKSDNMSAFDKICYCAENMRKGKCPYDIAKKLFPNAYKEKQR